MRMLLQVEELSIDYSECATSAESSFTNVPSDKVSSSFKASNANCSNTESTKVQWKTQNVIGHRYERSGNTAKDPVSICSLKFPIPNNIGPPVLFYYRLTNFYQNHRRYVKSLDTDQLKGHAVPASTIKSGSCDPLRLNDGGLPYYPCGLIANSLFNDSFNSPVMLNVPGANDENQTYPMTNNGIAWNSDKVLYGKTKYKLEDIAVPPNWQEQWPDGYTEEHPPPVLEEDEGFQVWMRTAGLPAFSKLALRNDNQTMKCGTYQIDIVNSKWSWQFWDLCLTMNSIPCHRVWRHQVDSDIYSNRDRREESIPWHRIHCRRWHMRCSRGIIHSCTSHQTTVCLGHKSQCYCI